MVLTISDDIRQHPHNLLHYKTKILLRIQVSTHSPTGSRRTYGLGLYDDSLRILSNLYHSIYTDGTISREHKSLEVA